MYICVYYTNKSSSGCLSGTVSALCAQGSQESTVVVKHRHTLPLRRASESQDPKTLPDKVMTSKQFGNWNMAQWK